MAHLVGEGSEKRDAAVHRTSMMVLERVEGGDEGAIVGTGAVAQDNTYSLDHGLQTLQTSSPRHPYRRLQVWAVEAASVPA